MNWFHRNCDNCKSHKMYTFLLFKGNSTPVAKMDCDMPGNWTGGEVVAVYRDGCQLRGYAHTVGEARRLAEGQIVTAQALMELFPDGQPL